MRSRTSPLRKAGRCRFASWALLALATAAPATEVFVMDGPGGAMRTLRWDEGDPMPAAMLWDADPARRLLAVHVAGNATPTDELTLLAAALGPDSILPGAEDDPGFISVASVALQHLIDQRPELVPLLVRAAGSGPTWLRFRALVALRDTEDADLSSLIIDGLRDAHPGIRRVALWMAQRRACSDAVEAVVGVLAAAIAGHDWDEAAAAIATLTTFELTPEAVEHVCVAAERGGEHAVVPLALNTLAVGTGRPARVAAAACRVLASAKDASVLSLAASCLQTSSATSLPHLRQIAMQLTGGARAAAAQHLLSHPLFELRHERALFDRLRRDPDPDVRLAVVEGLHAHGERRPREAANELLSMARLDQTEAVRGLALTKASSILHARPPLARSLAAAMKAAERVATPPPAEPEPEHPHQAPPDRAHCSQ